MVPSFNPRIVMNRFISIILVILLSAATAYAQPRQTRESREALKAAKEHLQYEEFHDAIPYIQELLEEDPSSAFYNFWMGKCLYITYQRNKALPYFEQVEKVNPEVDDEFYYYFGLTLHYNLLFEKAIQAYRKDLERYEPASAEYAFVNNRVSQCLQAKEIVKRKEGDQVKISNMGSQINSPYSEHSPVISANDSLLVYTARRPECLGAKPDEHFYDEDLYVAYRKGDTWTKGENIGHPVNSKGHDATISLTADAKTLYIYRHKKAGGLYRTDFDEKVKKWNEPRAVEKPLNSKYYEASICESADGNLQFFTSDRPGGFGGRDIYFVKKNDKGEWSEPINLGAPINSKFDEDAPYFHPDGKTLYYSSNGPQSMGGFDIFVTELVEGTWLEPLNMGYPVNTSDDDIYFVISSTGKSGYYSSGKEGGFGEKDIYHIEFPYFPYPRRYNIIELAGVVQDVNSLDTIPAMVFLVDNETNKVLDSVLTGPETGQFYFVLEPERSYSLQVKSSGYPSASEEVNTPILKSEDILMERTLLLSKPIAKTEPKEELPGLPEIQHIYFDFDKYDLRQESKNELDMVIDILNQNPKMDLTIKGHTDWFGTYDYNVALSENRSNAAYTYLLRNGIPVDRIHLTSFSENKPLETNTNDDGRQYNRRCEFLFNMGDKVVLQSKKLRSGMEGVYVDHTTPKGLPGFDNPDGTPLSAGSSGALSGPTAWVQDESSQPTEPVAFTDISSPYESPSYTANKADTDPAPSSSSSTNDESASYANIELKHIYFDFDKFNIREDAKIDLRKVLDLLKKDPTLQLEIYGHTDAFGSNAYNQTLSENRCSSTYQYLAAQGIDQSRLKLDGFSEDKPIDTNDSNTGRQNNRRVEFRIVKNGKTLLQSQP